MTMRTFQTVTLLALFAFIFCQKTAAQTQPSSPLEELQQRMLEMQRQMMEQFKNSPFNDLRFDVPQWDTTFFFRFDTAFEGGNISQFFRFPPFGDDSTNQDGFLGFDRFFDQFFDLDGQFEQPDSGIQDFPADDGAAPPTEDGLLPEERLRQQEEDKKSEKKQPEAQPAAPKPDPKVKTIRI
jgi:hypothetical protein